MRRFGRKLDVDRWRLALPISPVFFDCFFIDGAALIDELLARRFDALAAAIPSGLIVARLVTPQTGRRVGIPRPCGRNGSRGGHGQTIRDIYRQTTGLEPPAR